MLLGWNLLSRISYSYWSITRYLRNAVATLASKILSHVFVSRETICYGVSLTSEPLIHEVSKSTSNEEAVHL